MEAGKGSLQKALHRRFADAKNPADFVAHSLAGLREIAAILDARAPNDAAAFKVWLISVGEKVAEASTEGGFLGFGGVAAGMAAYVKDGVPVFAYNYFEKQTVVKGNKPLPEGKAALQFDFVYAGGGVGKGGDIVIKLNGEEVGRGHCEQTVAGRFGIDTFGIGEDSGQPVTPDYQPPFKFNGKIEKVVIELK